MSVINVGFWSFNAVLQAVLASGHEDLRIQVSFENDDNWSIIVHTYGVAHKASACGGGVVVHLEDSLVKNFTSETHIGQWLAGNAL